MKNNNLGDFQYIQELLATEELLKMEISFLIEERDNLLFHLEPFLQAMYMSLIGKKEVELMECELERKIIKKEIKVLQRLLEEVYEIEENKKEKDMDKEIKNLAEEISSFKRNIEGYDSFLSTQGISEEDMLEVRGLYIKAARKLHPYLVKNISEEEKDLWERVTEAYKNNSINELKAINYLIKKEPKKIEQGKDIESELNVSIEELQNLYTSLRKDVDDIRSKFPFDYEERLSDEGWIEDTIIEMDREIYRAKIYNRNYFKYLNSMKEEMEV